MKITMVGGGSYAWTPTLFRDLVCTPALEGCEIVLQDINRSNLAALHRCCKALLAQFGKERLFRVTAEHDLDTALRGATAVLLTISTGGLAAMEKDVDIPYTYGIYQPVGDTVGPGGLLRSLRNIPVVVDIARRMERQCPAAWLLNLTNPMTTLTRSVWRETDIRCVGLCHELYGTLNRLQKLFKGKDWRTEFEAVVAGVNHLPWILELRYRGRDAFPMLRRMLRRGHTHRAGGAPAAGTAFDETLAGSSQVKFALFELFGALPAAGDRHVVEFFPYFCTRAMRKGAAMGVKLTTIDGRRKAIPRRKERIARLTSGGETMPQSVSAEAAAKVVAGLAGQGDWTDVVNLPNQGQLHELPSGVVVETMGMISRDRVRGLPVGAVPPAILTQIQRHVTIQEMTVEAALTGDARLALQALYLDPLCGIIPDYRKVERMFAEMLRAQRRWLPQFGRSVKL